jgi:hypothetical protein
MPSIDLMVKKSSGKSQQLKDYLDKKNENTFTLLRWIVSSNRTHLEPATNEFKIPNVPTGL